MKIPSANPARSSGCYSEGIPCAAASLGQRVAVVFLLLVMIAGTHFHVVFLQFYGWSHMTMDYREKSLSWTAAVDRALSGDDPCVQCGRVEQALFLRQDLDKPAASLPAREISGLPWLFLLPLTQGILCVAPPVFAEQAPWVDVEATPLFHSVEKPPPRLGAA